MRLDIALQSSSVLPIRDAYPGSEFFPSRLKYFSVADPGCLSRIPDPDFYPSRIPDRIPDQKTGTKEMGEKKIVVKSFYVATNFTKI